MKIREQNNRGGRGWRYVLFLLALAALGLTACGGRKQEKVVEITLAERGEQTESGSGLTVSRICTYEYEVQLHAFKQDQMVNLKQYEDMDMVNDYLKSKGIAQAGFDGEKVYLVSREEGAIVTKYLDMEYGFYEKSLEDAADTDRLGRIWTSPDGSRRLLKVYDGAEGCWCLDWQERDGSGTRIMADHDRLLEQYYDVQCVWSGDGSRAFVRFYPLVLLPEYDEDSNWGETDWTSEAESGKDYMLEITDTFGLWMLSGEGESLSSVFLGDFGYGMEFRPRMIASDSGSSLFLTTSQTDMNRMSELGWEVNETHVYLEENAGGEWSESWSEAPVPYGPFQSIELRNGILQTLNVYNQVGRWNPELGEYNVQGEALGYKMQKMMTFHQTTLDRDFTYGVSGSDIYRMEYDEADSRWNLELIYKGPSGAQFLDMAAQPETGNLLLHYMLGQRSASLKLELVLLTF